MGTPTLSSTPKTLLAISVCFSFAVMVVSCSSINGLNSPDSAANVVVGYCDSAGEEVFEYYGYRLEGLNIGKTPSHRCEVIDVRKPTRVGEYLGKPKGFHEIVVNSNDLEIIVLEHFSEETGKPPQKFWYLLRDIPNLGWRIISHTYIPDENYPAHD